MSLATIVTRNRHVYAVTKSVEVALDHIVRERLYFTYGSNITAARNHIVEMYNPADKAETAPNLAHALTLYSRNNECTLALQLHDLESGLSEDSAILYYDFNQNYDPNYRLVEALHEVAQGNSTLDQACQTLAVNIRYATQMAFTHYRSDPLGYLQSIQQHFGYPDGDRRNLVPDSIPENMLIQDVLRAMPNEAVERLRELAPLYETAPAPAFA